MAIWQYDIHLLPRARALEIQSPIASKEGELIDTTGWWDAYNKKESLVRALSRVLPEARSWSPELRTWGAEGGHRIDLWGNGWELEDVMVRIDLREPPYAFCQTILNIAQQHDLMIVLEDGRVISPETTELVTAIEAFYR
jgi:hypothetical protein